MAARVQAPYGAAHVLLGGLGVDGADEIQHGHPRRRDDFYRGIPTTLVFCPSRELEDLLAERDEQLHPVVEAGGTETLVRLAERGVGVAFLPRFAASSALERGALVELASSVQPIRVWNQVFVHKDKPFAGPLRAFVEML